jgi:hypothetical protein
MSAKPPLVIPHESTAAAVVHDHKIPVETALFINVWAIGTDRASNHLKFF